jgi:hypothetical protein
VYASEVFDYPFSGPKEEVIGIAQYDAGTQFLQFSGRDRLHRCMGTDRHKYRCFHHERADVKLAGSRPSLTYPFNCKG